ncbi:hypothetical protein W97_07482 [Coniosporium apollinis CBS 100218]|uniref:ACB domain-containing protein n=1 Tax=Coniosporium apollinis (strain CBS 100218) TaxID=1168221 RepID=R7Z2H2_CONA1|nr:uncharacterized protein W97_07482 [Coniosporium apollinis CBS 100218]EON68224.1 hypothetical protein W97_07482 [Coniosporium apollinis CBS 100218]
MTIAQSPAFKKAAEEVKNLKATPSQDEMLELYGLYKQGTQDPAFDKATAPGMFDLKGKAKYNAWKKVADAGTKPADAQKQYVEVVNKLKAKHGTK